MMNSAPLAAPHLASDDARIGVREYDRVTGSPGSARRVGGHLGWQKCVCERLKECEATNEMRTPGGACQVPFNSRAHP
jgi:hypothetical protein